MDLTQEKPWAYFKITTCKNTFLNTNIISCCPGYWSLLLFCKTANKQSPTDFWWFFLLPLISDVIITVAMNQSLRPKDSGSCSRWENWSFSLRRSKWCFPTSHDVGRCGRNCMISSGGERWVGSHCGPQFWLSCPYGEDVDCLNLGSLLSKDPNIYFTHHAEYEGTSVVSHTGVFLLDGR